MTPNPSFLEEVEAQFPDKEGILLAVGCKAGPRAAAALRMLEQVGSVTSPSPGDNLRRKTVLACVCHSEVCRLSFLRVKNRPPSPPEVSRARGSIWG